VGGVHGVQWPGGGSGSEDGDKPMVKTVTGRWCPSWASSKSYRHCFYTSPWPLVGRPSALQGSGAAGERRCRGAALQGSGAAGERRCRGDGAAGGRRHPACRRRVVHRHGVRHVCGLQLQDV